MAGFLKFSSFKQVLNLLANDFLVGYSNGTNIKISFTDLIKILKISAATGGGAPIKFEGDNLPDTNNLGEPLQDGNWVLLSPGEYNNINGGDNIIVPDWAIGFSFFDNGVWGVPDIINFPEILVSDVVKGNTGAVSGVGVDNYTFQKIDAPAVNSGHMDLAGNLGFYIGLDGKLYADIAKSSLPPGDLQVIDNDFFDFAVGDNAGNIIFGILKNGDIFPEISSSNNEEIISFFDTLESYIQPNKIIKDSIWNQWIEPVVATDVNNDVWATGVGNDSKLYLSKMYKDGRTCTIVLGDIISNLGSFKSDDHNAPALLFDNRPDAEFPLMVFQVDHNTTPMRVWKFTSLDIADFDVSSYETIGSTNLAYSQPHRYGDEIFIFARRPALPRPWRILYSSNNGGTWVQKDVFFPSADWLYMLTKDSKDGNGVHLMSYGHPQNSQNQNIYYLYMDFATGEIRNPATGIVIADIRNAMVNSSFEPIDPFTVGFEFYSSTGTEINRMWDFKEAGNDISLILTSQDMPGNTATAFLTAKHKVANFNFVTGVVNFVQDLNAAGFGVSGDPDEYSYWAGACLIDPYTAVTCHWMPKSISNGGNDVLDNNGVSTIKTVLFDGVNKTEKVQFTSKLKVMRPYVTKDTQNISIIECRKFDSYANFLSNLLTIKTNSLKF